MARSCPAASGPVAPILAAGEQSQRQRAPDAAHAVNRHRADRIVDAQVFQQFDAEDDDDAGDRRPGGSNRSG